VKKTYRNSPPAVTPRAEEMPQMLEDVCRAKLSELFQAVLEAEVDAALERLDTNAGRVKRSKGIAMAITAHDRIEPRIDRGASPARTRCRLQIRSAACSSPSSTKRRSIRDRTLA